MVIADNEGRHKLSEPQTDVFLEIWLRRLLGPARRRARAGPTSAQLGRLRHRVFTGIGIGMMARAAA